MTATVPIMRPQLLYTTDQGYTGEMYGAALRDGSLGRLLGSGEGSVQWGERSGVIEWTNFPARRPDGAYLPNLTGVIKLEGSGHGVLYRMHGVSVMQDDGNRHFSGSIRWYTDEPDLDWLNDTIGFEEGVIDPQTTRFVTRAYALHPEDPAP